MLRGVFAACQTEVGEMEDYKEFAQYHLSQLRESEDNQPSKTARSSTGPSLIRFHGRSILPPLLSGNQKEEMQRHRDAAQRMADRKKSKTDARIAYVQNILHSVQLRKAPTLEEFFHEEASLATSKTSHCHSTNNVSMSQRGDAIETKDSSMFSPPSGVIHDGKGGVSVPPLTSTLCGAFSAQHFTPDQSYQEGFSIDQYEDKIASQPITDPLADISHQSLSSGYVTYENAENATSVSGRIEAGGESLEFVFEEVADNTASFFIHNTSNTVTKMPDIINHPPIDGEDLEKCEFAPFIYDHFKAGPTQKDICSTSPQQDSVICPNSGGLENVCGDEATCPPIGESKATHLGSTECEERSHSAQIKDSHGQEQNHPGNEGPVPSIETSCHSGNLNPLEKSTTPQSSASNQPEIQNQARDMESVHNRVGKAASAAPPVEPYHMSLQALLKKSQEYRRRQRLLRNQDKNARNQEITQREQLSKDKEESGLSDKENDGFPNTGRVTAEGRKTREKRVTKGTKIQFSQPAEMSPNKAGEDKEKMSRREGIHVQEYHGEKAEIGSKNTHLTEDGNTDSEILTGVEEELASKDNQLDSSEFRTESKQADKFPKPLPIISTDNSPVQEAFFLTREQGTLCGLSRPCSKGRRKFQTVPTPQFCMSPIRGKGGGVSDGVGIPKRKVLVNTPLNVLPEVKLGQENNRDTAVSPTVPRVGGSDEATALATNSDQAQQIDQLVLNLSSLKALISDLESTLTENHGQDDMNNSPSDLYHKLIEHTGQTHEDQHIQVDRDDYGYWEDRQNNDDRNDTGLEQLDSEGQRRKSLDNYKTTHGDTGPEPSLNDPKDPTVLELERGNETVNVGGVWLARTSATETGEDKGTGRGGLTTLGVAPCKVQWSDRAPVTKDLDIMSYGRYEGCKQQPGCIVSLAQKMRVPDVFRKVPKEVKVPHKGSVLSDTSNQPMERIIEITVEGDSSHLMSLNQSYDVDTPSGLWLQEGSGSDLDATGHDVQGKHLTPEYGGQGGAFKAKRRLLMHATEGNEEGKWDRFVGDGSVVRPHSSTPKASLQRHGGVGGQEGKLQQQLKLTHAAQVRALKEEQRRQQQELLKALAERYRLLQSMSFPCPTSSSRLGDASTSPTLPYASEPSCSLPEFYRPLVVAAVKGFLTRRLLKTERVAQLVRTIKDTQQFLLGFQPQTPGRGEFSGKQDLLLLERVTLQLRSARHEVHDIFFSVPVGERMQLISWDRELGRERELRRQSGEMGHSRGKSSLSAATQKSLERKRGVMIQKKAVERQRVVGARAGPRAAQRAEPRAGHTCGVTEEPKRGQFKANPRRVPKTTSSCRPR